MEMTEQELASVSASASALASHDAPPPAVRPARVLRALDTRVLPLLWAVALVAYIDRSALAYAAAPLRAHAGIGDAQYGVAASVFFAAYVAFEVPANLCLPRVGAPRWLALLLVGWGAAAAATAAVSSARDLYAVRLVLGAFEAGAFPAIAYTIHDWYGPQRFLTRYPVVTTATALAGALGGPLAAGALALAGWRALFVIEGVGLAWPLAALILARLPRRPEAARWLSTEEVDWLRSGHLAGASGQAAFEVGGGGGGEGGGGGGEGGDEGGASAPAALAALLDWRCWYLGLCWMLVEVPTYGCIYWIPNFISKVLGYSEVVEGESVAEVTRRAVVTSLVASVPFGAAAAAMVGVAHLCRARGGERDAYAAAAAALGSAALAAAPHAGGGAATLAVLTLAAMGVWAAQAPLLSIPSTFLEGSRMGVGFALVNTLGQFGGLIGPACVGFVKERADARAPPEGGGEESFALAFALLGAAGALAAPLLLLFRVLARGAHGGGGRAHAYARVDGGGGGGARGGADMDVACDDGLDELVR